MATEHTKKMPPNGRSLAALAQPNGVGGAGQMCIGLRQLLRLGLGMGMGLGLGLGHKP